LHLIHAESSAVPYKTPSPACTTAAVMNLVLMPRSPSDFLSVESINNFGKCVRPQRNQSNQIDQTNQSDQTD